MSSVTLSTEQLEKVISALDVALGICQFVGSTNSKPPSLDESYHEIGEAYDDLCALAGEHDESTEEA